MASVSNHYQNVIDSVINASKEIFFEEGVDEQILLDLKNRWKTKLEATKAVDCDSREGEEIAGTAGIARTAETKRKGKEEKVSRKKHKKEGQQQQNKTIIDQIVSLGQQSSDQIVTTQIKIVMVKGGEEEAHVYVIKVPTSAMEDDRLHNLLTSSVITAITSLPQELGNSILQQHVNAAFFAQPQNEEGGNEEEEEDLNIEDIFKGFIKVQERQDDVDQIDGCNFDSSDDDDDNGDRQELFGEDTKEGVDTTIEEGDEEPLNSEDDITDEEHNGLFDSENIVVCQYEKVTRVRNKWKLNLKAGIMYLHGKDFLFHKAVGDTEW